MRAGAIAVVLALGTSTAHAACEAPSTGAQIVQHASDAELAFSNLDVEAFFAASDAMRAAVPCVGEPLTRRVASQVHRFEGLRAVLERDNARAEASFAAARLAEPHHRLPTSLVPQGNPVREMYDAVNVGAGAYQVLEPAAEGTVWLDGGTLDRRPTEWPVVWQFLDLGGAVVETRLLSPADPTPTYVVGTPPTDDAIVLPQVAAPVPPRRGIDPRVVLGTATVVGAVVAVSAGSVSARNHKRFWDPDAPADDLELLKARTNTMTALSVAGALGTAGFGIGLAVSW